MSALSAPGYCAVCGQRFFFIFWLIFAKAKIKREFRALRSATQGSALRTRGLLKKAGENFIVWCGAIPLYRSHPAAD